MPVTDAGARRAPIARWQTLAARPEQSSRRGCRIGDDAEVSEALIAGPAPGRDARRSSDSSSGRQLLTASAPHWTQISGRALAGLDRKRFDVVDRGTERGFESVCVSMRLRE